MSPAAMKLVSSVPDVLLTFSAIYCRVGNQHLTVHNALLVSRWRYENKCQIAIITDL